MKCDCGNTVDDGGDPETGRCDWCVASDGAKDAQVSPHTWQRGRMTGTTTCEVCGLLPLDSLDWYSDCPGNMYPGTT